MLYQIENRNIPLATGIFSKLSPIPHIHSHLELIYMEEGTCMATVDYQNFLIEKGDLFLSFPNQIHYYHDRSAVKGYLFIFSPDVCRDLKEIFQKKIPCSPIIRSSLLPLALHDHLEIIRRRNESDTYYDKIAAKGYLLALLAELLPLMNLTGSPANHDSIKNVLAYCSENYTKPLTLEQTARELHLNKYYISHIFNERIKISFVDFINGLRIEHACTLLEQGCNITEIAFSSGFSSIRTFNRVFAQSMNMAPRDYIKYKENGVTFPVSYSSITSAVPAAQN
ncbi:MAG: AraC family transcriptional regulator [Lachnospiraceae bacterium]|nr:AraC family transcriptional regulator [uncultured Acetatifactor sp.]MCI8801188.1 AraC family transcriptional regulator [Lachnospiraceae bacterium]